MNKVVASSMNGSHIGRLIARADVTGSLSAKPFWYAYITNIQHKRDGTVTLLLSVPPDQQDQRQQLSNFMARSYTWTHHMYLKGDEELTLERG